MYIDLANYYIRKSDRSSDDAARAVGYAELETKRVPNDPRAWFYLGLAYQCRQRPVEQVRGAWLRSYRLDPVPSLKQRLDELP